jgi:DNA topoisomerase-6 subunit B
MVVFVHIASVWVPFTSESKEAIAAYPEIEQELRLALQEVGRKLAVRIKRGRRLQGELERRTKIETYLPHVGLALQEILQLADAERDETIARLDRTLHRTRSRK